MRYILILLLCVITSISFAKEDNTIRIGFVTWPGSGTLFVGKDKNYFEGVKVETKVIDDTTALVNAFRAGELDAIATTPDGAALQFGNGFEGKIGFITDNSTGGDGIIAKSGITSVKDLKGKTVGYARAIASHYLLYTALKKNGLSMADIKGETFDDGSLAGQALFSGKVDAAVTWEPYLSQAQQKGIGTAIVTTKDYPELLPNVFIFSEKTLAQKPETIKKLIAGWIKAVDYSRTETDASAAMIAKGFGLKKEDAVESIKGLTFVDKEYMKNYFCGEKPNFPIVFNDAAKFWKSQNLVKEMPKDGKQYITTIGCDLFQAK